MTAGLTRDVSSAEVEEYRECGVVRLRGILADEWLADLGRAIDQAFYEQREQVSVYYDSTEFAEQVRKAGGSVLGDQRAGRIERPGRPNRVT